MRLAGVSIKEIMHQLKIKNKTQIQTKVRWHKTGNTHRFEQPVGKTIHYESGNKPMMIIWENKTQRLVMTCLLNIITTLKLKKEGFRGIGGLLWNSTWKECLKDYEICLFLTFTSYQFPEYACANMRLIIVCILLQWVQKQSHEDEKGEFHFIQINKDRSLWKSRCGTGECWAAAAAYLQFKNNLIVRLCYKMEG